MSAEDELDLTDTTADEVEDRMAGRDLPDGVYLVEVTDVVDSTKEGEDGTKVIRMRVMAGDYKGCRITDKVRHPMTAEDDEKRKLYRDRMANYARKLRIIEPADFGNTVKPDWLKAIGRHLGVVFENGSFVGTDGVSRDRSGVKFFGGLYYPWDARMPQDVREEVPPDAPPDSRPGTKKTGNASAATTAGKTNGNGTQATTGKPRPKVDLDKL